MQTMAALPVGPIPVPRSRSQASLRLLPTPLPQPTRPPFDFDVECPQRHTAARPPAARPATRRPARRGIAGRLVPGALTLTVLAGVWYGAGALTGLRAGARPGVRAPGATLVAGQHYVVQPGDSLWSIALRLDPSGDPRPIVDELTSELGGASLQAGERIVLP
jgi:hypothetical protein